MKEEEEEEQPKEDVSEAMEEDEPEEEEEDPEIHAMGLNMTEAETEFIVAEPEEMVEQHAILDSIRVEAGVKANRRVIWQRQAKADALYADLKANIAVEEAVAEASEGRAAIAAHLSVGGTEIVHISDE
ncbi:Auxin response factor 4 [Hordeum vulgare]|nr:Auxin response factor 4 [Hordeum vulgare]